MPVTSRSTVSWSSTSVPVAEVITVASADRFESGFIDGCENRGLIEIGARHHNNFCAEINSDAGDPTEF